MKEENGFFKYVIISIITVGVLIISLIGFLVSKSKGKANEKEFASQLVDLSEQSESASTQIGKSVEEAEEEFEIAEQVTPTPEIIKNENRNESVNKTKKEELPKEKKQEINQEKEKVEVVPEFDAPIKGEIIREFANNSLVFSNTLQEWITHNGIDIKADKTSVIKSAAKGTVSAIKNDPRYGLTVIINHDGGYQTIYSNLLTAEFVVKGEKVEIGQSIGTVGNSAAFEIADDEHLHFELLKDNEYLDPTTLINF